MTTTSTTSADPRSADLASAHYTAAVDFLAAGTAGETTAAVANALLYIGIVLEDAADRQEASMDALGELLDDAIAALANRPPWWQRLLGRGRQSGSVPVDLNYRFDGILDDAERAAAAAGQRGRR
jgi:hypothetical protein